MNSLATDRAARLDTIAAPALDYHDSSLAARLDDLRQIVKPRISVMVLFTVAIGYGLGCAGDWRPAVFFHALLGIAAAATASSAINQYLERFSDALMPRTALRPLPAGRLAPGAVLLFGLVCGAAAIIELAVCVNTLTAVLTLVSLVAYVALYTPLKPLTSFGTVVGAVSGALPPVLGWTAAGGTLDASAAALFGILFLWQFPHFWAIAWLYRRQYAAAGLKMLPSVRSPHTVGVLATGYAIALIPLGLLPRQLGLAGDVYAGAALLLGLLYAAASLVFAIRGTDLSARRLLWASLLYLPGVFGALAFDHWRLLQ
ncbi:MAG: protoheme IX farnesyltransferase [Planctomycetota bacterium]|nr:MAG: protoheme IX farnesyltransferase [Planctomycetota bacterium]REJ91873.1 MAG: protoheme IX farnesyltransferase [Planctomycetota bacterium]REK22551.1 MAG: protoheme IX farnesyltransferase [Planctomycetota bacterium]REK36027.1 MAG: protoheme IX farnesyltransferase [Planctomycetota bacterium]